MKTIIKAALLTSSLFAISTTIAVAEGNWTAAPDKIDASIRAGSRDVPVQPGEETQVQIRRFTPGATVTIMRGTEVLTQEPVTIDDEGGAIIPINVPEDAETGNQPLTVLSHNPDGVMLVNLKLSEVVPPSGDDKFTLTNSEVGERAYQMAVSEDGKLYVASARGENEESRLLRLNAGTLEVEGEAELAQSANSEDGVIDVFGVGVDDAHGQIWTTNTLNDTVTVYDANDLSVVKVFEEGSLPHPRDVVIDEANNRAYVNAALTGNVHVYDTEKLEHLDTLTFQTPEGREVFGTMTLDLDAENGRLYSVSRAGPHAGWIDLKTGESHVFEVPALNGGSGIAHDPETGRMYIAGQDSNNLVVLDAKGEVLADTYVGAGAVSTVWDATTKQAYVATRAGGSVAVVDADGKLIANLALGDLPNHLAAGSDGAVYALTMFGPKDDDDISGAVTKITVK